MSHDLKNLLTDVAGLRVGHTADPTARTGVTVVVPDEPAVASVHVMGGAPGTRETDLLAPEQTVTHVDAIVLSGGSAFGLEAAAGVADRLKAAGRGYPVGSVRVPLVPAAILFDLLNNSDRNPASSADYRTLGMAAFDTAGDDFALGSVGAGTGASTTNLKGGLGSASSRLASGCTVAALVAVNPFGQATIGDTPHFWAAPFEIGSEFGGLGLPPAIPQEATQLDLGRPPRPGGNTTLAVVATDATLTKAEAKRLSVMAHDGFPRALWPTHTPYDGDLVFALSTSRRPLDGGPAGLVEIGAAASLCVARAIARAVYEATSLPSDRRPAWRDRFRKPGR